MQQNKYRFVFFIACLGFIFSCRQAEKAPAEETHEAVQTPVTVTGVSTAPMQDYIELNASSAFLQKNFIKANANGYLQSNFTQPGQYVNRGQSLFTIRTKKRRVLATRLTSLIPALNFPAPIS